MTGLAAFAIRSALGPLRRIEGMIAARDHRDLTPLDVAVPREIGQLVAAINRFMARQARQVRDHAQPDRRRLASAPHPDRRRCAPRPTSPPRSPTRAASARIVARIHDRAVGLSRLTDQLLNHALIIHRADAAPREIVDLRTVAIRTVEESDADLDARPRSTCPRIRSPAAPTRCR